jgi:hypothetical protein
VLAAEKAVADKDLQVVIEVIIEIDLFEEPRGDVVTRSS